MNLMEVRQKLHNLCEDAGSIRAWSEANGLSFSHVAAVRRGDVKPSSRILNAMGMRKAFRPNTTQIIKYEDVS